VTRRASAPLLFATLCAAARIAHAECPEGAPQAACLLHEEGVALLSAARYDEAAVKFRAAIAAAPSARSYLGYSQAVEGQGKLALAYETMLVAQRLSNEELEGAGAKDPAKIGRAERIKYKLGELGGRVGFVWLRLPEGVPPQRLVSIHRDGEGDLPSPIGRWVTVAPDKQVLIASLDDGTQLQVVAKIAPGSQSNLVLPIPAAQRPPPQSQQQQPQQQPPPLPPPQRGQPSQAVYQAPPAVPRTLPSASLAVGMTFLAPGPELSGLDASLSNGIGIFGLFERRAGKSLGLSFRADYVAHPSSTDSDFGTSFSGREVILLAGLRTMTRTVHARLEAGVTVSTVEGEAFGDPVTASRTDLYPVLGIGAGLQAGRLRFHASILYAANSDSSEIMPEMPIRFMGVIGIDLWRR
jgi:hypothetical protein